MPIENYLNVSFSDDKLVAYLEFMRTDDDNFSCDVAQLEELLKSHFVQFGLIYHVLSEIARSPQNYVYEKTAVAVGVAPVDGQDGYIKFHIDMDSDTIRPVELEDGTVDYKEIRHLPNVQKDQLIAEKMPAQEGVPGQSVTGEILFPKAAKEARLKIGKNVHTDEEQKYLYASVDGLVVKTEKDKINVFPVYEVSGDVDYRTGNIDFVGNVVIRGNVLTGFKVKADGDIRVTGGVEGAELEAGGSIEILAGVLGHQKGLIRAGMNVKSSFIQEGNVEAEEDVIVSQSIMHSRIRAGKNVYCQGTKGFIVGGIVQAGEKVIARTIGNTMSTVTSIEVGVLPELRNNLQQLRVHLKTLSDNLDKSEKALHLLDQLAAANQMTQDKIAMRIKLNHSKKQYIEEIDEIKENILEIEKALEDTEKAQVEVISTVYGGTKIVIGRYTRFIKDPISRVIFKYVDGDISLLSNG